MFLLYTYFISKTIFDKFLFLFFENELILQSKAEETKGKPAKQEREAYQIEQLDLKKGE